MGGSEENRIFVGGLGWNTTERHLEEAFSRYGKIVETLVMIERETGRPRGFGFITFADRRAMEDAIREMHGRELDGRVISVNKAQPKAGSDDSGYTYGRDHAPTSRDHAPSGRDRISGGRDHFSGGRDHFSGSRDNFPGGRDHFSGDRDHLPGGRDRMMGSRDGYRGVDKSATRSDECFKCGRPGHWARDCPSSDVVGSGGGRFSSHSKFGGGGRGDRFGDRFDDQFDGGRYGDKERTDNRDNRYARDRYNNNDRYQPGGDRFGGDRYVDRDRDAQNGYSSKDKGYSREGGPRGGGGDRFGSGGPARFDRGSYRGDRPTPYDRPRRAGRPSSYERY